MVPTNLKTLFVAVCAFEYGEAAEAALLRLLGFNLPIAIEVKSRGRGAQPLEHQIF